MKPRWLLLILLILAVVAFWIWSATRPDAVVDVIRPRVETIRAFVEEQAVTRLPTDFLISMPINGWLERIDLLEGTEVKKDQVVANLEKEDLMAQVRQVEQRIAVLETNIQENSDNRLELNMLVQAKAIVKAIDETVQAAEKQVEASQAVADFAKSELERLRRVEAAGAAAEQEIRSAETNWRRATAEMQSDALELAALRTLAAVSYIGPKFITDYIDRKSFKRQSYEQQMEEARAQLEIEKRNLARAEIRSPIDGVVLERHETRRQYLAAGTPLLTLGRLQELEIRAEVLTERAMRLSPGDPVEIFGEGLREPIAGKVVRIEPAGFKKISSLGVEQQRVNVIISLDRRPERLGVEFRVNVRIFYDEAKDALTLPRTALFRDKSGGWRAMAVRDGRTVSVPVSVGLMNDEDAAITSGLSQQDVVVAIPSREITEGMRVDSRAK